MEQHRATSSGGLWRRAWRVGRGIHGLWWVRGDLLCVAGCRVRIYTRDRKEKERVEEQKEGRRKGEAGQDGKERKGKGREEREDVRGFGSVRREDRERMTLKTERAGDQLCFSMSMQTFPRSEMFMWYILSMSHKATDNIRSVIQRSRSGEVRSVHTE